MPAGYAVPAGGRGLRKGGLLLVALDRLLGPRGRRIRVEAELLEARR